MTEWIPPAGMTTVHARAWREFFRKAGSGAAGYTASWEDYVILYRAQLGRCYICQRAKGINPDDPKARGSQRLGWDHNHKTGMIRGLLCTRGPQSCNRMVGIWRDDPEVWARGQRYLQSPPALVLLRISELDGYQEMNPWQRSLLATSILGVGNAVPLA